MDIHAVRQQLRTKSIYDIPLRVTYYARVSSESDEQLNSLENQIRYYEDLIRKNRAWTFVPGYIDEGKSQAKNAVLFQQTILRYFVHFGQHEKATRQSPAGSLCFIVLFPCYFRVLCVRFSLKYERAGAARPPPPSTRPAPCSHSARLKPFAGSCSSRFGFA